MLGKSEAGSAGKYRCRCQCGTERDVNGVNLRNGKSKSCGCKKWQLFTETRMQTASDNETKPYSGEYRESLYPGEVFGYWTVLEPDHSIPGARNSSYLCRCVCGNVSSVKKANLLRGRSKSCGCMSRQLRAQSAKPRKQREKRPPKPCPELEKVKLNPGDRFGKWTVLERAENRGRTLYYKCRCDCGTEADVIKWRLLNGTSTCCHECIPPWTRRTASPVDIAKREQRCLALRSIQPGDVFGYWTVLGPCDDPELSKHRNIFYKCRCVCGKEKNIRAHLLYDGKIRSCGCIRAERGDKNE